MGVMMMMMNTNAQLTPMSRKELEEIVAKMPREEEEETVRRAGTFVNPNLCDTSVNQTAGYLKANASSEYFFWLFESQSEPSTDPLIMWLSGGPGCSSQLALFAENGPCKVSKDGTSTTANPYSWHKKANVMWVDQPEGVGFSTGLGTRNEAGVAANMYTFLTNFFSEFPQYRTTDFYIFGESYAGHYVPAIAHKLWAENKNAEASNKIPLKGIAIGNGLTDPEEQYKWYPEMVSLTCAFSICSSHFHDDAAVSSLGTHRRPSRRRTRAIRCDLRGRLHYHERSVGTMSSRYRAVQQRARRCYQRHRLFARIRRVQHDVGASLRADWKEPL